MSLAGVVTLTDGAGALRGRRRLVGRLLRRARSGHRAQRRAFDLDEIGRKRYGKLCVLHVIECSVNLDAFPDMHFELILCYVGVCLLRPARSARTAAES